MYTTTPCVWETVKDSILVKEEVVKYVITEPEFKDSLITLRIEGVIEEGICIPAVTGTDKGTVEIEEACTKIEVADYTWEDEEFFIEVSAPSKRWVRQKADENCLSANPDDCLVWRLEEVPGESQKCVRKVKKGCPYGYEDNGEFCIRRTKVPPVTKDYEIITCEEDARFEKESHTIYNEKQVAVKVLKTPATYKKIVEPAEYTVIERQVLVQPPRLDSAYITGSEQTVELAIEETRVTGTITETPAVEESCTKILCVEPKIETKYHEPKYKTVTTIEIKEGSFTEWREVLCPAEINSYTIGQIQHALYDKGYDPGPIDNEIGKKTKAALIKYQKNNELPIGQLDYKTLEALDIKVEGDKPKGEN